MMPNDTLISKTVTLVSDRGHVNVSIRHPPTVGVNHEIDHPPWANKVVQYTNETDAKSGG